MTLPQRLKTAAEKRSASLYASAIKAMAHCDGFRIADVLCRKKLADALTFYRDNIVADDESDEDLKALDEALLTDMITGIANVPPEKISIGEYGEFDFCRITNARAHFRFNHLLAAPEGMFLQSLAFAKN